MDIATAFFWGLASGALLCIAVLLMSYQFRGIARAAQRVKAMSQRPKPHVYMEGKLIHVSNDGRKVAFEAVIEIEGETTTICGLSEEEANSLRPLMCRQVCLYVREVEA